MSCWHSFHLGPSVVSVALTIPHNALVNSPSYWFHHCRIRCSQLALLVLSWYLHCWRHSIPQWPQWSQLWCLGLIQVALKWRIESYLCNSWIHPYSAASSISLKTEMLAHWSTVGSRMNLAVCAWHLSLHCQLGMDWVAAVTDLLKQMDVLFQPAYVLQQYLLALDQSCLWK